MAGGIQAACLLATAVVLLAFPQLVSADLKGSLTIQIDRLRNQKGEVCLKVFSGAQGFPNGNAGVVKRQCLKIQEIPMTVTFTNLKSGSYAIAAFHDLNGDRQLNRNPLGMPTEDYGFSRNPNVRTGPPQFRDAVFMLAGPRTTLKIRMQSAVGG